MSDSQGPRLYRSDKAPTTPQQGDIQFNVTNNRLECYTGSAWGTIEFNTANAVNAVITTATVNSATVGTLVATEIIIAAGYPSLNTASPAFYIPAGAGALTGAIPSLALRVPIAYNTDGAAIMVRVAGSWFTTASLSLA